MDEMWSFVGSKMQKVWIWLAQDEDNREIVGCAMADRSAETAQELWDSLPPIYRQCAFIHADFWEAYAKVLPSKRYKAVGKKNGKTCYIERLFPAGPQNTLLLEKDRTPQSGHLEFYPSLQRFPPAQAIMTSIGLPIFFRSIENH